SLRPLRRSLVVLFACFFFSSRRRHTRCLSDWSSDVCSSDLGQLVRQLSELVNITVLDRPEGGVDISVGNGRPLVVGNTQYDLTRSEERRVGKECRYRESHAA